MAASIVGDPAQALEKAANDHQELKALGAMEAGVRRVAVNSRRWWRHSDRLLRTVLTTAYFGRLGAPRLS